MRGLGWAIGEMPPRPPKANKSSDIDGEVCVEDASRSTAPYSSSGIDLSDLQQSPIESNAGKIREYGNPAAPGHPDHLEKLRFNQDGRAFSLISVRGWRPVGSELGRNRVAGKLPDSQFGSTDGG